MAAVAAQGVSNGPDSHLETAVASAPQNGPEQVDSAGCLLVQDAVALAGSGDQAGAVEDAQVVGDGTGGEEVPLTQLGCGASGLQVCRSARRWARVAPSRA